MNQTLKYMYRSTCNQLDLMPERALWWSLLMAVVEGMGMGMDLSTGKVVAEVGVSKDKAEVDNKADSHRAVDMCFVGLVGKHRVD